jgi:hypothetical protein
MVKLAEVVAWVIIVFGLFRAATGFFIASRFSGEDYAFATKRYLGSTTTGEAIDQGLVIFVVGLVIGLLAKIANKNTKPE